MELECAALDHLAGTATPVGMPRVVRTRAGAPLARLDAGVGQHRGRNCSPGSPGAPGRTPGRTPPRAMGELGRMVARVDAGLASFAAPGDRPVAALEPGPRRPPPGISCRTFPTGRAQGLAGDVLDRFAAEIEPRLRQLPSQPIHNDANDANVLVGRGRRCRRADRLRRPVPGTAGLRARRGAAATPIDAGPARTATGDPWRAVLPLVAGYHEIAPLRPGGAGAAARPGPDPARPERRDGRLAARRATPATTTCWSSQDAVWALLERLAGGRDDRADACAGCGTPAASSRTRAPARSAPAPRAAAGGRPVLGRPLARMPRLTFDWSAGTGRPPGRRNGSSRG